MKSADEYLKEYENKPVYYHIYCYFDSLLKQFNQPYITTDEPGYVLESCKASVVKGAFAAEKAKDLILVYLGKFDLKSGKFEIFDDCLKLLDLNTLLLKKEVEATDA